MRLNLLLKIMEIMDIIGMLAKMFVKTDRMVRRNERLYELHGFQEIGALLYGHGRSE